jgi:hypothetical protein
LNSTPTREFLCAADVQLIHKGKFYHSAEAQAVKKLLEREAMEAAQSKRRPDMTTSIVGNLDNRSVLLVVCEQAEGEI